jgi:S1-C subfamily serine protease
MNGGGVMRLATLGVLTFAIVLATRVGAAPQDVLTLRAPGGQLGATFRDVSAGPAAGRGRGAVVVDVLEKSPAVTAGIRVGDLVTIFDGLDVLSSRDLNRLVAETPPGRRVRMTVVRAGRPRTLTVTPVPGR